jgi:hypothetical protein
MPQVRTARSLPQGKLVKRYGPDLVLPELLHKIAQCVSAGNSCAVQYDEKSRMP